MCSAIQRRTAHWSTRRCDHWSIGVNAIQTLIPSKSGWPASRSTLVMNTLHKSLRHALHLHLPSPRRLPGKCPGISQLLAVPCQSPASFCFFSRNICSNCHPFCHGFISMLGNLLLPTQEKPSGNRNRLSARKTGRTNHLPITCSSVYCVALNQPRHDICPIPPEPNPNITWSDWKPHPPNN